MLQLLMHKAKWYFLTAILSFILHSSAIAQGSDDPGKRTISVSGSNVTLQSVLKTVEKQTGMRFNFGGDLDVKQRISIGKESRTLSELLSEVFSKMGYSWKFIDDNIFLIKNKTSSTENINSINEHTSVVLNGFIGNEKGAPLSGVSIGVVGTNSGTITDENGKFQLKDLKQDDELLISSVGFQPKRMKWNGQKQLDIILFVSEQSLETVEVLSTGYQTIPKERATGSFVQIDNELFNREVGPNVLDRILDVTSGLVYQPGKPTTLGGVTIRGVSTINANRDPLIVIDNFPFDGDINNLNPNDIQSITVLKDAAAASIWGVRAGNGVIVITTKKGKLNQKNSVQFNTNVTIGEKPGIFDMSLLGSKDVIEIQRKLFNEGYYDIYELTYPTFGNFPSIPKVPEILIAKSKGKITDQEAEQRIKTLQTGNVLSDINEYLLQNSINQQYALNMSGGTSQFTYYGSIGYDKIKSNEVGNLSDRFTVRLDNTYRLNKRIEISSFLTYVQSEVKSNSVGYFNYLPTGRNLSSPYTSFKDANGNASDISYVSGLRDAYLDTATYPALLDWRYRILDEQRNKDNVNRQFDTRIGANLKYNIIDGLTLDIKYQYQKAVSKTRNLFNQNTFLTRNLINRYMTVKDGVVTYPVPLGAILDISDGELSSWNIRPQLNYNKSWESHDLVGIAGIEFRETRDIVNQDRKYGFNTNTQVSLPVDYVTAYSTTPTRSTATVPYMLFNYGKLSRYRSFYGNFAYTYNRKYTLTGSARLDGSNFYGVKANQRIVPLWSLGIGWDISREQFYNVDWMPYLKLRSTIGYNGNTNNSAAAYPTMVTSIYFLTRLPTGSISGLPNSDLRWERVKIFNLGLDFETKNARISGTIEYYRKNSVDLISETRIDPTYGLTTFIGNNASLKVSGVDFSLLTKNIVSKTFSWGTNFLVSYNRDKITNYTLKASSPLNYLQAIPPPTVDRPLNSIYGFKSGGLDPVTGDPRLYVNGKVESYASYSSVVADDMHYLGTTLPKYFGAIRNTLRWKNLSASINITFKAGYYYRRESINYDNLFRNSGGHTDFLQRWQKAGDETRTNVPATPAAANATASSYVYTNSDILIAKGDHFRLQDLRLSYDVNSFLIFGAKVRATQIYMHANNLGIIWRSNKYHDDPDYVGFPTISRTIALGINISL